MQGQRSEYPIKQLPRCQRWHRTAQQHVFTAYSHLPTSRPSPQVRKLEFLLAEAREKGHDSVITIGGIQSNHARATAVAARYLGWDAHLVLRNSRHLADSGAACRARDTLLEHVAG